MFITHTSDNKQVVKPDCWRYIVEEMISRLRRLRTPLCSETGFTLTEVLATVIILGLVTAGMATAITVGTQQFNRSMALSEGQQLYSSISRLLENDLRSSVAPITSGPVTSYQTVNFGNKQTLYLDALDDEGDIVAPTGGETTGYGQLAFCSHGDDSSVKNRLLGRAAYNYGLRAKVKSFNYDTSTCYYTIELAIGNPDQNYDVVDETFTVYSLQGSV